MERIYNVISYLLGGIDTPIICLLIVLLFVYITGWCQVLFCHKINKLVGIKGIIRNIGYLLVVSLSVMLDRIMGSSEAIRTIVIYFFIAHEGLVILKCWCKMGLPLPKKIYSTLEGLLGEEEENGNTIERQE